MKQVLSIQYLRGIAALSVAAFHMHWMEMKANMFPAGAAGVDLFFVISGFIMFTITREQEDKPAEFFWRRLVRIVPLYWMATFLIIALQWSWPGMLSGKDVDIHPVHIILSLFFIADPRSGEGGNLLPTLPEGWTLNIEMFFYILVAVSLFLPKRRQLPFLTIALVALAGIGVTFYPQMPVPRLLTNPMILELLAGLWLGQFMAWNALPKRKTGIFLLVAGFLGCCMQQILGLDIEAVRPNMPVILIVLGALSVETDGGIFESRFLKLAGDASYSMYLLHRMVLSLMHQLDIPKPFCLLTDIVAVFLAGVIVFTWFEKPLLGFLRKRQAWSFGRKAVNAG